ncbi:MAG: Rieske 2Fe-2S domain-containing protein [Gemmatimonadaceae bacterium]
MVRTSRARVQALHCIPRTKWTRCSQLHRRGKRHILINVGSVKDIAAGEMRVFDVAGTRVTVASADGQLHAFDDTCTHTGCSLAKGKLTGTTVTCACHGSQFDVTSGAVLRGPAQRPERSRRVQVEGENLLVEG